MQEKEIRFDIRYVGGDARTNKLDLYDASISMLGFAKALSISTHALVTKGDIRVTGSSVPNVKIYLHPAKKGSFIETVSIIFEDPAVNAIGISLISSAFWAMLEYSMKIASGQNNTPTNKVVKNIINEKDAFDVELSHSLENPLQQIHRPIKKSNDVKIQIKRPKKGQIIEFDFNTKRYVSAKKDLGVQKGIICNITKYNILTGFGRLYVDDLDKTIPFRINKNELRASEENILTWSLFEASNKSFADGKISIEANVIVDNQKNVRQYVIVGSKMIKNDDNNSEVI